MTIEVKCKQCGKLFEAQNTGRRRKYCSKKCSDIGRREPKKPCPICGKMFSPARSKSQTCSRSCGSVLRQRNRLGKRPQTVLKTCIWCKAAFEAPFGSNQQYCGSKCRQEKYRQDHPLPDWKAPRICTACGTEFVPKTRQQRRCSAACSQPERVPPNCDMVRILITKTIPVFAQLRPEVGQVYLAEDHRVYGSSFFIIPDICGKRIVVRSDECRVLDE